MNKCIRAQRLTSDVFLEIIHALAQPIYSLENSCDNETCRPCAISSRLRIEMFRFPRSTSAKKLRIEADALRKFHLSPSLRPPQLPNPISQVNEQDLRH